MDKKVACFGFSENNKCNATISTVSIKSCIVRIDGEDKPTLKEPFEISNTNWKHNNGCLPKNDEHFITKSFIQHVKM